MKDKCYIDKIENLEAEKNILQSHLDDLTSEFYKMKDQLNIQNEEIQKSHLEHTNKINQLTNELFAKETASEELTVTNQKMEKLNLEIKNEKQNLKTEILEMKDNHQKEISHLKINLQKCQKENKICELKIEIQKIEDNNKKKTIEIQSQELINTNDDLEQKTLETMKLSKELNSTHSNYQLGIIIASGNFFFICFLSFMSPSYSLLLQTQGFKYNLHKFFFSFFPRWSKIIFFFLSF